MLTVMAGPDIRDWYAGPELSVDYRNGLVDGVQDLHIGYSRTLGYAKPAPDVVSLVDKAVEDLASLGAHLEEIDPGLDDPIEIMQPLWSVGLALGVASMTSDHRALIDAPLLDLAEPGFRLTALDYRRLE
jgi:aspartyl-tRNA(Asn)/glutamyl-tRNA(Gln) amidotransferase subunit A